MDRADGKIHLLVVDDEKAGRDVLINLLSTENRLIRTARNGLEARDLLLKNTFDLILTDLNMPGMDGLELLRFVKTEHLPSLVIIITGYATLENTLAAIEEGAYDYITKPFKLAEMEILVRNACEKISLLREHEKMVRKIEQGRLEIEALQKRVRILQGRIRQLEAREENLFLGNFDLRLSIPRKALPVRYAQGSGRETTRQKMLSLLKQFKEKGEINEEEFEQYLKRIQEKRTPPAL